MQNKIDNDLTRIFLLLFCLSFFGLHAQKKKIELAFSTQDVFLGDDFIIQAELTNIRRGIVPEFPELPGFKKTTVSLVFSSYSNLNGSVRGVTKYQQYYKAVKQGVFRVPVFTIKADGASATHGNFNLTIKGLPEGKGESYLLLETSKDSVYVGEPFKLSLSFIYKEKEYNFLRHSNDFHDKLEQLKKKIIRPSFWIEEIKTSKEKEYIYSGNGERMIREVLYQVVLVPQNSNDIKFDSLNLDLLKKVSTPKGLRWLTTTYGSSSETVIVKELPEHPLRGRVPVGKYRLREGVERVNLPEGENTVYTFEVSGEGNLASLLDPSIVKTDSLLIFKEGDRLEYSNDTGKVSGRKVYQYNLVPDKPGNYEVKNYIFFPYFNSETEKYDTLKSEVRLTVTPNLNRDLVPRNSGEKKNLENDFNIRSENELSEELRSIDQPEKENSAILLLLLFLTAGLVYVLVKKRR